MYVFFIAFTVYEHKHMIWSLNYRDGNVTKNIFEWSCESSFALYTWANEAEELGSSFHPDLVESRKIGKFLSNYTKVLAIFAEIIEKM